MKSLNFIHINIQSDFKNLLEKKDVAHVVKKTLEYLEIRCAEVSFSFIDAQKIRELNNQYRGIDSETDVLAFEGFEVNPENDFQMLGDILISVPIAQKQALEMNHSLGDEIKILIIHGLLHLLGYDHVTKKDEEKMFTIQRHMAEWVD